MGGEKKIERKRKGYEWVGEGTHLPLAQRRREKRGGKKIEKKEI